MKLGLSNGPLSTMLRRFSFASLVSGCAPRGSSFQHPTESYDLSVRRAVAHRRERTPWSTLKGLGQGASGESPIGRLLETADAGDVLVAAEVSRLARSTLQVLELLQAAAERGVTVHIAKNRMVLDDRRAQIVDYLNKGVSKRSVAKILGCSPTTLYSWIRRRRISGR